MTLPKVGMHYEDVRTRVKRIAANPQIQSSKKMRLVTSLLGQSEACDGSGAKEELIKELTFEDKAQNIFPCSGPTTCGFGDGKKLGDGTWRFDSESSKWERVE